MTLDLRWRLGRLGNTLHGALRHLRREGVAHTVARAGRQLREMLATGTTQDMPPADLPADADGRPRILIVDALMPDPSRDSGSVRICNVMRVLHDMGWTVDFMPDSLRADADACAIVHATGARVACRPRVRSLAHYLRHPGCTPDAVMLCRHYVASAHIDLVRRYAPSARLLFDTVDLHHIREMRAARHAGDAKRLRQARRTQRHELDLIRRADTTFVVSPLEKTWLQTDIPEADVRLLSNIHHVHPPGPGFAARRDLFFVGGWGHPPNRDAVAWLAEAIMPQVWRQLPEVMLHLVGDLPETERAAFRHERIIIHGRIPDLEPILHHCRLALAPLRYGAGVKGKINTPMSHGVPVVATSMAVEGMFLQDGRDVLVGDNAETFADAVVRAYSDATLWQTLADGGRDNVRQHFSFDAARESLEATLAGVSGTRSASAEVGNRG